MILTERYLKASQKFSEQFSQKCSISNFTISTQMHMEIFFNFAMRSFMLEQEGVSFIPKLHVVKKQERKNKTQLTKIFPNIIKYVMTEIKIYNNQTVILYIPLKLCSFLSELFFPLQQPCVLLLPLCVFFHFQITEVQPGSFGNSLSILLFYFYIYQYFPKYSTWTWLCAYLL